MPRLVIFFDYPFAKLGQNFPLFTFYSLVFCWTDMAPCQLLPRAWRVLTSVETLSKNLNIDFIVDDLAFTYQIEPFGKGRFMLKTNEGRDAVVEKVDTGRDRGWAAKYCYVRTDSIGGFCGFFKDTWRSEGILPNLMWILHSDCWRLAYTFCWTGASLQSSGGEQ